MCPIVHTWPEDNGLTGSGVSDPGLGGGTSGLGFSGRSRGSSGWVESVLRRRPVYLVSKLEI